MPIRRRQRGPAESPEPSEKAAPRPPKASAWRRADRLVPTPAGAEPALVSDGGGLAFPVAALLEPKPPPVDAADPAAAALLEQIRRSTPAAGPPMLGSWRTLARTDEEVLFGHGRPPALTTVAVRREGRPARWTVTAVSSGRQLRAAREGTRASSWRPDPSRPPSPEDEELRILVTEQAHASGKLAHGRLLPPDLHIGGETLTLRLYVEPLAGWQNRNVRNPETPAIVALPEPLGNRTVRDGAIYAPAAPAPAGDR